MTSAQLVRPAFCSIPAYHGTDGPEVAGLAELAGFAPDPEQRLALDAAFAFDKAGKAAAFEVAIIAPRQNIKTGFFKQCALGWLFITDQRLIVWSAHEFNTAVEAFRDMTELIESSDVLTRRVKRIYRGNGDESIEMMSGQRLIFKARTKGGGRGLSGDKVVLDEGFALQPVHMGALLPTLSARPDPQVLVGSSAGLADSAVLRSIRDRGRAAGARIAYFEWTSEGAPCADKDCSHVFGDVEGCALDDVDNWRRVNSQLGLRVALSTVEAERRTLTSEEFARERMGWWDEPGVVAPAFGLGQWESVAVDECELPTAGIALGVAVSLDRAWASIGAAAPVLDKTVHVGAVDRRRGVDWLPSRVKELQEKYGCDVVVDGRGPGSSVIPALEEAGVKVTIASTADVLDGCAGLFDAVQEKRLQHMSNDELDTAVAGAQKRLVGDRWAWGRKTSTVDVSMLEAVTLAHWSVCADPDYDVMESFV